MMLSAKSILMTAFLVSTLTPQRGLGDDSDDDFGFGPPSERYFDQDIDHTGIARGTFKQLYFEALNPESATSNVTVNFLMLGGDEQLSSGTLQFSNMVELARKFNANMFALEHRFFGKSNPGISLDEDSLMFLEVDQVIEDIAQFIRIKNKDIERDNVDIKWFVFGGGYGGSIAAWSRVAYPGLISGAIASSAPVQPQFEFDGFLESVGKALPAKCFSTIKNGANKMIRFFLSNKAMLKVSFNTCSKPETDADKYTLMEKISDIFETAVEYNIKGPKGVTAVNAICDNLLSRQGNDFQKLSTYIAAHYSPEGRCTDYSYEAKVKKLQDPSLGNTDRAKLYLKCFHIGNFRTTKSNAQPFAHAIPLVYYDKLCKDVFGEAFDQEKTIKAIEKLNEVYKGKAVTTRNIAFVHGSADPWISLGKEQSSQESSPVIIIKGGYHCQDMLMTLPDEPQEVTAAKEQIADTIDKWILGTFH